MTNNNSALLATAKALKAGSYIKLEENHVMNNKQLTLSFNVPSLSDDGVVRLGHGETSYGGSYIELTPTELKVYNYTTEASLTKTFAHGLTLSGCVNIVITTSFTDATVTVSTSNGTYTTAEPSSWQGRNGAIFAVSTVSDLKDVKIRWSCSAYTSDIWLLGDSYFN